MSARKILTLIGALSLLAGLIVGFLPLSSGGASCGSALNSEGQLYLAITAGDAAASGCESLTQIVRIPTWLLLAVGAVLLVVALVMHSGERSRAIEDRNRELGAES